MPTDASSSPPSNSLTRRSFLKTAAAAGAALAAAPAFAPLLAQARSGGTKRNLIFFLNDQERATQWFPAGWEESLPGLNRLKRTGISFSNACCNTAMCTPSRSTIFTGTYPTQNGSTDTLTEGFPQSPTERQLNPNLPNLATILKAEGYDVVYLGKWHLTNAVHHADGSIQYDDISRYGFDGWIPPDAGQDVAEENFGGGDADHDGRYMGYALDFLQDRIDNPSSKPFCLVISLVNPHDVLTYPGQIEQGPWESGGYTEENLEPDPFVGQIPLPPTVHEDLALNHKPTTQVNLQPFLAALGPFITDQRREKYLNFYADLIRRNDEFVCQVLDLLEGSPAGMELRRNSWIIRTSDHGEMGLSHGSLRQKSFLCYEEALKVPLVWSNPVDFPDGTGVECPHLVSHIDFLPTVCAAVAGVSDWKRRYTLSGMDYSALLGNPRSSRGVQDYIYFTFDDVCSGASSDNPLFVNGAFPVPNRLEAIRTAKFKYVRYYDADGVEPDQEEFYDLRTAAEGGTDCDAATGLPVEMINYSDWAQARRVHPLTIPAAITREKTALLRLLTQARRRLVPLDPGPFTVPTVTQTPVTVEGVPMLELFWYSLATMAYQIQESTDGGITWQDAAYDEIAGNNGPILFVINDPAPNTLYRLDAYPAV